MSLLLAEVDLAGHRQDVLVVESLCLRVQAGRRLEESKAHLDAAIRDPVAQALQHAPMVEVASDGGDDLAGNLVAVDGGQPSPFLRLAGLEKADERVRVEGEFRVEVRGIAGDVAVGEQVSGQGGLEGFLGVVDRHWSSSFLSRIV